MKLKLSHAEFDAIFQLLAGTMQMTTQQFSMEERLSFALLAKTYLRFYKKAVFKKKNYSVSLPDEECINWWLFFTYARMPQDTFIVNLVQGINNNIHQQFQN